MGALPLSDSVRDQGFAERCTTNVRAFEPGVNGRVSGLRTVHAMRLTEVMDGLAELYLPVCHAGVFGLDPLRFVPDDRPVTCRGCLHRPVVGRAAPPLLVRVHGRYYRDPNQLEMAYPPATRTRRRRRRSRDAAGDPAR